MKTYNIEFLEKEHFYLIDGILVESVTQIIKKIFPDKYKGIDKATLSKASEFGTKGHKIIETIGKSKMSPEMAKNYVYELYQKKEINQQLFICLREYLRLCSKHSIEIVVNEIIVNYGYDFVGTLDIIAFVNGKKSLIDIKFTSELDKEYLSWQLGMYKLASNQNFEDYYCLWLPKGKIGKLEPIEIKRKEIILDKLKEILEEKYE